MSRTCVSGPPATRPNLPPAEIRSQLLTAGRRVFEARGYAAATVHEIATLAGVCQPSLFRHFHCKKELFRAAAIEPLRRHLADALIRTTSDGDAPRRAMALAEALQEHQRLILAVATAANEPDWNPGDALKIVIHGQSATPDDDLVIGLAFALVLGEACLGCLSGPIP